MFTAGWGDPLLDFKLPESCHVMLSQQPAFAHSLKTCFVQKYFIIEKFCHKTIEIMKNLANYVMSKLNFVIKRIFLAFMALFYTILLALMKTKIHWLGFVKIPLTHIWVILDPCIDVTSSIIMSNAINMIWGKSYIPLGGGGLPSFRGSYSGIWKKLKTGKKK